MSAVLIFGFAMLGLLAFGTIVKWIEVRRAAHWQTAPGRITRSRVVTRKVKGAESHSRAAHGNDMETRNFADIAYEFRIGNRRLTGKRVSTGEDLGNWRVEETLAQYPKDAAVTVYYNPKKPTEAVLERDAPEGVFRTMAIFIAVLTLFLVAAAFGTRKLLAALSANMRQPELAIPVVALSGIAIVVALITRAGEKRAESARNWPWVDGEILATGTEAVRMYHEDGPTGQTRTRYKASVLYQYEVDGVTFTGTRRDFGPRFYSASRDRAARAVGRLKKGDRLPVYYDPANRSESVLEPHAAGLWIGWVAAAVVAALAVLLAF
jgi:hypothetical protein